MDFVQRNYHFSSLEVIENQLNRINTTSELNKFIRGCTERTSFRFADHQNLMDLLAKKANILLPTAFRSVEDRDQQSFIFHNLARFGMKSPDAQPSEQYTAIMGRLRRQLGQFVHAMDERTLFNVASGAEMSRCPLEEEFMGKIELRFRKLLESNEISPDQASSHARSMIACKHPLTEETQQKLEGFFDKTIESETDAPEIIRRMIETLACRKMLGIPVDEEVRDKWLRRAEEHHILIGRDAAMAHSVATAARILDKPEIAEKFYLYGQLADTNTSRAEDYFFGALQKMAANMSKESQSNLKIAVEQSVYCETTQSNVDYKVTISGGSPGRDKETIFWVQFDGPYHFRTYADGKREESMGTQMQNKIFEDYLPQNEFYQRVDYRRVLVEELRRDIGLIKQKEEQVAKDVLESMVGVHNKYHLGTGEFRKSGFGQDKTG